MNIAICDDESVQQEYLRTLALQWSLETNVLVTVSLFPSAEAFWFAWSEQPSFDVILLDIQMGKQNGVALARQIRETDETISIIFITGITDYLAEGYEVSALHYLQKPVDTQKLFRCLDKIQKNLQTELPGVILPVSEGERRILLREILYIEAFAHSVEVHLSEATLRVNQNIGTIKELLRDNRFHQCHRSYLVNLEHVAQLEKGQLTLTSGQTLPVSRKLADATSGAFFRYYRQAIETEEQL